VTEAKPIVAKTPVESITDWYLPAVDPLEGYFWPNRVPVRDHEFLYEMAKALGERCIQKTQDNYTEFVVREGERAYRGHVIDTVKGRWFALRKMPDRVPPLETLGLDKAIQDLLAHKNLAKNGGLIIICGETGQGKSTTIASAIMRRMENLGSFCLTIEDPPEMPLHGIHGKGICYQTETRIGDFAAALRGAMRSYPAVGGSMLYVGETRDPETAAEVMRASVNGLLVLTTLHANDPTTAVQRFTTMAKAVMKSDDEVRDVTASALRLVMHQELEYIPGVGGQPARRRLRVAFAFSENQSSPMAQAIRSGDSLQDIVDRQKALIKTGGVERLLSQA
jgi:Tfp pilus assembly pilus retraction ATPase PilT